jgi:hypothetical protein
MPSADWKPVSTVNRGGLDDAPFEYRESKSGRVVILWRGRQVLVLKGRSAAAFASRIADLDPSGQQLAMAKVTGNFKRGNEKGE